MNCSKTVASILAGSLLLAASAFGQSLQTLYQFGNQPPFNPDGGVALGPDGNFYGTTYRGGAYAFGAVYRLTPGGILSNLFDFNSTNGTYPVAGLLSDGQGSFYGVTQHGGASGYGVAFRITTNGDFTVLANFNPAVGSNPQANLIWGNANVLYGTTPNGGDHSDGAIFSLTTNGVFTTLFSFSGTDGSNPQAALLLARDGNFYGTTEHGGGNSFGTVFRYTLGGSLTNLGAFDFVNNGLFPASSLVEDDAGNLYGTSTLGGGGGAGSGALFEVPATNQQVILGLAAFGSTPGSGLTAGPANTFYGVTSGSIFRFTSSHTSPTNLAFFAGTNGLHASAAPILDASGNLYGTTTDGGTNGYGAVYELDTHSNLVALYSFFGSAGSPAEGGLLSDANGTLYGTTEMGGAANNGTIYSLDTNGTFKVLLTFASTNGAYPWGGLIFGTNGLIYGTTELGGGNGAGSGTVFRIATNGMMFTNLAVFNQTQAYIVKAGLVQDASGNFYGTSSEGGAYNYGAVFKVDASNNVTVLANFDQTNGQNPNCVLTLDSAGNLWGTTTSGGPGSFGTIFKLSTNGIPANTYLVPFALFNGVNGSAPMAGLTMGTDGAFYGTTYFGGAHNYGCVFRVTSNGVITNLFSFAGGNGAYPATALVPGTNGDFFGTTSGSSSFGTVNNGTLFRVTTNGALTTFFAFNGTNGSAPSSPLLPGKDGAFYGTTANGSPLGSGTIFKLSLGPINPVSLNIQATGKNISVLTWSNPVFNLLSSPAAAGPYTNVPDASSPYTNSAAAKTLFFRLQAQTE